MDPGRANDRFEAANELFALALDLPPEQRTPFVLSRCGGDLALQDSVLRLLDKFAQLGDFLEQPACGPKGLQPGDLLAGRFLIDRKLGAGGMGEVYRAEDRELHETIALKLIRSDFQQNRELEERFRSEIRVARKITHVNVCRTFDVFSCSLDGQPLLFFTMQLLEGETLAARIRARGPFPPAETLDLAAQIAAGLDAAHRERIVHRDLKPANIMLVPAPGGVLRAVITDFGLARPFEHDPVDGVTQPGQILGSPQYMAPEQFLGTGVTTAADIYTLALMVLEMISGVRPFPDESIVRAAIRRTTQDAPSLSSVAPGAPSAWARTLARALSRDPADRPATAGEFVRELEESRPRIHFPSRRALLYIAGGCAVSSVAVFLRLHQWGAATLPKAPLLMFANASATGPESQSAAAFLTLIERQLDPAHVGVVTQDRIHDAWRRMHSDGAPYPSQPAPRDAREVALRAGANLLAFSGATRKLDDWSFWLRLELLGSSPAAPVTYWEHEFKASAAGDRFAASTTASHWLRETVGASLPANLRERSPQELTTNNWEALVEYTEANDAWVRGNRDAAARHLKTALDLDPEFPLAANRMADILISSGQIDEGLAYYSRAATLARSRNLTDRESLRMRTLFALDTGQSQDAEQAASRWAAEYQDDFEPLVHRATALECLGQVEPALHLLDLAVQRNPKSRSPRMRRAMILLRAGRFDEAARESDVLAKIPPADSTWQLRSALAFARLDTAGAWDALEQMRRTGGVNAQSTAYGLQACHRAEQGRHQEAAAILRDGIRFDSDRSLASGVFKKRRLLAQLLILDRRFAEAREQCRLTLTTHPGHAAAMEIGCSLAQAGDLPGARACLRSGLPAWPIYSHWQARLEGEIALASGDAPAALTKMLSAPRDATRALGEWPAYVVHAAYSAGQLSIVKESLNSLLTNPAAYWFNADYNSPGFLAWALQLVDRMRESDLQPRARMLRQALAYSN